MKAVFFLFIIAASIAGYLYYQNTELKSQLATPPSPIIPSTTTGSPIPTPTSATTGTISGKLCYPSEFLPAGKIVAKNIATKAIKVEDYQGTAGGADNSYSLELGAGEYNLRYQTGPQDAENPFSGYYTPCAKDPNNCQSEESHELISVTVENGETQEDINLCDFYMPEGKTVNF